MALHEAHDADLEYGAPAGDHDDLVLAAGYAQRREHEVAKFRPQELPYPEGSYGEVFGIQERLNPVPRRVDDPFARD